MAGEGSAAPQPGDQIFFGSASCSTHTGLVAAVSDGRVTTIEGNSGDQVTKRSYDLNYSNIYGYGRPKWSAVEESETSPADTSEQGTPEQEMVLSPEYGDGETEDASAPAVVSAESNASTETETQASQSTGNPVNKTACASVSLPELETGDIGREVKTLQALLKGYGYDPGEIDGEFGPKTKQAVESYQSSHGLAVDGICGKNTWTRLLIK